MKRYCTCKGRRRVLIYYHRGRKRGRFAQPNKDHLLCRQCFRSLNEPNRVAQRLNNLAERAARLKELEELEKIASRIGR